MSVKESEATVAQSDRYTLVPPVPRIELAAAVGPVAVIFDPADRVGVALRVDEMERVVLVGHRYQVSHPSVRGAVGSRSTSPLA